MTKLPSSSQEQLGRNAEPGDGDEAREEEVEPKGRFQCDFQQIRRLIVGWCRHSVQWLFADAGRGESAEAGGSTLTHRDTAVQTGNSTGVQTPWEPLFHCCHCGTLQQSFLHQL